MDFWNYVFKSFPLRIMYQAIKTTKETLTNQINSVNVLLIESNKLLKLYLLI